LNADGIFSRDNTHADYHNLYSFEWAQSIARGYARNGVSRRPFLMARSGAAGTTEQIFWRGPSAFNTSAL
jgi:alpha-glucosidase (family GH31 glycosyl hydrolase)